MSIPLEHMSDDDRSAHLLDYVHGRLKDDERVRVEAAAATNKDIAEELAFFQGLAAAGVPAERPQGHEMSWARLSRAIETSDSDLSETASRPANDNTASKYWRVAAIAFGVLLATQTSWILATSSDGSSDPIYIPVAEEPALDLQVIFRDSAPAGEISDVLSTLRGNIVSGPSALGVYQVRFASEDQRGDALEALRSNTTLVESAFAN
ncbi:MAG: hypothetical protein AAFY34_11565 [Pseudomonadota bacterium]